MVRLPERLDLLLLGAGISCWVMLRWDSVGLVVQDVSRWRDFEDSGFGGYSVDQVVLDSQDQGVWVLVKYEVMEAT